MKEEYVYGHEDGRQIISDSPMDKPGFVKMAEKRPDSDAFVQINGKWVFSSELYKKDIKRLAKKIAQDEFSENSISGLKSFLAQIKDLTKKEEIDIKYNEFMEGL